ncbi:mycofactocin-coupled SDR family oxidoreductase [Spirillospora sp. CA-255316]
MDGDDRPRAQPSPAGVGPAHPAAHARTSSRVLGEQMTDRSKGRVAGKVALISGAARGQGRSHAVRLAEEGADVIGVDLCGPIDSVPYPLATADDLAETADAVKAAGGRIVTRHVDVRDLDALTAAVREAVAELGRLDIVVSNAGISSAAPLADMTEQTWQDLIDVNLTGTWHMARAAIPHLREDGGSIIITSSSVALKPARNIGHYVATKNGLTGLMRVLALELADSFIRVNCVLPTAVSTPMIHNESTYAVFRPDLEAPTIDHVAEIYRTLNALPIPWVESIDISNAVLFLASDEARYITGAELPVDAGYAIK